MYFIFTLGGISVEMLAYFQFSCCTLYNLHDYIILIFSFHVVHCIIYMIISLCLKAKAILKRWVILKKNSFVVVVVIVFCSSVSF